MKLERKQKERSVARVFANVKEGLTSKQVLELTSAGFSNVSSKKPYKPVKRIIFENVFTYFNLIFFVLGFCLLLVGSYKDMSFLFVVILNILIGTFQQIRSKIKIDKLNLISALKSVVVRDEKEQVILNSEVVRDDIIIFKTGDQITVDAVVLEGEIQVDESLLTGETDPILKTQKCELLSGSFVLSGKCVARVERVGDSCYASSLANEAKKDVKHIKSEMMNAINKIIKIIGFTIIPFGVVLFLKQTFLLKIEYAKSIKTVVAAVVGMIPEGLYLLTSVALLVSVIKLIESKVLVHDMSCIETLARVDVVCVDKTGTITEPKMKVVGVKWISELEEKIGEEALNAVIQNMPADNATSKALKEKFIKKTSWQVVKVHPFLSSTKWFGVEFLDKGSFLIGAPEFVLKEDFDRIENVINKIISEGKRVLLLAKLDGKISKSELKGKVMPLALISLENPIRKGVHKTFGFFQSQGVNIKVISGDNPLSVLTVCKRAKIDNIDRYVDASTLKTDEEIKQAVKKFDIFGRVTPVQKRKIVRALQTQENKTVAMVGDGVNDVLALRASDVGVAMASGSEAASQACELVLLNSDFEFMPNVVMEGRRVINNIQRFAALFLAKNIFSFCFAFLALFLKLRFPIMPYQFTFISALTIGMPSFFLTMEPTTSIVKGSFIKNVFKKALPGGICNLIIMLFVQILFSVLKIDFSEISYVSATLLGITGLFILFEVCKPINKLKKLVVISMSVLMGCCILFVRGFSNIFHLSFKSLFVLVFMGVLIKPLLNFLILVFKKDRHKKN